MLRPQRSDDVDSVHIRQLEVDEGDIGKMLLKESECLLPGSSFGNEFHVFLALEHSGQALPQNGMIVYRQDANLLGWTNWHLIFASFVENLGDPDLSQKRFRD